MKKKLGIAALALFAASSLVACKPNARPSTNKPQPSRPQEEQIVVQQGVQKFTGETTIKDVLYKCELHIYADKTFNLYVLDENKVYSGTYMYFDNIGYKFIFPDRAYDTVWNAETKSHELTYKIRLGRKGSGNVTLSLKEEKFVPQIITAKTNFIDNATWTGVAQVKTFKWNTTLTFDKYGEYHTTIDNNTPQVYGGKYTFENNVFTLTEYKDGKETGKVYKSTFDPVTSTYKVGGTCYLPSGEYPFEYSLNTRSLETLYGSVDVFNQPGHVHLKFIDDKKALFDFTWGDGGNQFDKPFDREATYKVIGDNIEFTVGEDKFTTTYDRTTGLHKLHYLLKGQSTFEYDLVGKISNFGLYGHGGEGMLESDFQVDFLGVNEANEQEVVIRCITKFGSMNGSYQPDGSYKLSMFDKKGIFVKAEDGSLSIKVGETVYPLTFDADNGIYSFDYVLKGQQGDINVKIGASIWD